MTIQSKFITQTGVGESEAISILDTNTIRISYAVSVSGTITYTVQHSLDGITFFDNSDNTAKAAANDGNYSFPVRDIRVKVLNGTGAATLHVRQLIN